MLLQNSITATYRKADEKAYNRINQEAKVLATKLKINDRMERMAKQQAFVTLKEHKENFVKKPTCQLINPAKVNWGSLVGKSLEESTIV